MNFGTFSEDFIWGGCVTFARIAILFMTLPGMSESFVAARFRIFFALTVSLIIFPMVSQYIPIFPKSEIIAILIILQEMFVGFFLGSIVKILLGAASIGGNIISLQSSLSSATMFDPTQNTQNPIIGNLYTISSVTLLFFLDIHHIILSVLIKSFEVINLQEFFFIEHILELIIKIFTEAFVIAIKIATPYILINFLINVTSACIARVMPSISIFFIITPLQIWISIVIAYIIFLSSIEWYLTQIANININF